MGLGAESSGRYLADGGKPEARVPHHACHQSPSARTHLKRAELGTEIQIQEPPQHPLSPRPPFPILRKTPSRAVRDPDFRGRLKT